MSTKTSIKRIALVAVAALGFGMVSTVSASAANLTDVTGAFSDDSITLNATATFTCTSAGTDIVEAGFKAVSPSGTTSYVSGDLANATMGTIAIDTAPAQDTAVLTVATNFLNEAGMWSFSCGADGAAVDYSTSTLIAAALDAGSATPVYVSKTTPSYVGGSGYAVTSSSNITQIANGIATFFVQQDTASTSYQVNVTGGNFLSAYASNAGWTSSSSLSATANDTVTFNNGTNAAAGVVWTPTSATANKSYIQIKVQSASAATATVSVTPVNSSGVPGAAATATATFVATGSNAVSAANSTITVVNASASCVAGSNKAGDLNAIAATEDEIDTLFYKGVSTDTTKAFLCIISRDAAGTLVTPTSYGISAPYGSLGSSGTTNHYITSGVSWGSTGVGTVALVGDAVNTGATTISATLTDAYANSAVLSVPFTFFGTLSTLELVQKGYSAAVGQSTTAGTYAYDYGSDKSYVAAANIVAKDAGGNTISLGDTYAGATYPAITKFTVDSTGNAAAVTTRGSSDSLGSTASAGFGTVYEAYNLFINCYNSTGAEKLSVYVSGLKSDGSTYVDSAPITFYCASTTTSTATVTVVPNATEVAAGGTTTVDVTATDVNGYPVADGGSVTLVANNGSALTNTAPTFSNGKLAIAPTLVAGSSGPITVTAVRGLKTATAQVTVTGAQTTDALDAANEATDAANAATDAANAAAEAADAATAAAQDAQAAVAELATKVASLMAGIKAQITSLTNLVIKIQKKVKA